MKWLNMLITRLNLDHYNKNPVIMHICIADIVLSTYIIIILTNHNDKVKLKQDLAIF